MAVTVNIDSQIVVQTAAQWAADNTVYSAQRILITSDETYTGTDQRKFKIANGSDTWSNLDYFPVGGSVAWGGITGTLSDQTDLQGELDNKLTGGEGATTGLFQSNGGNLGSSVIVATDANKKFVTLSTATYPSLTELSYVKGVTSAIQTQIDGRVADTGDTMTGLLQFSGTGHAGLRMNNLTTAQRNALTPSAGMKVWDTDLGCECVYTGTFWRYMITKYISSDVTNSTNVQANITGLSFSLEANAVYRVSGVYQIGCNNTGGVTFFGTFPTSPTSYWIHVLGRTNAATIPNFTAFSSTFGTPSASLNTFNNANGQAFIDGLINNGANAGTFQAQFASGVNGQTSTIYARGTYLLIERIG